MPSPASVQLSPAQMAMLADHGEEHTVPAGTVLFAPGDAAYPFIAIREGSAALLDAAGNELVRHGAGGFLGEMGLLTGQTVFLSAVAVEPMTYVAVPRETLRRLLTEEGSFSELVLNALMARREMLQTRRDVGPRIVGPRSSAATRELVAWARSTRIPHQWDDDAPADGEAPVVHLPGGQTLVRPTSTELSLALGIALRLERTEDVDLAVVGGGPAGLGAAVYGASEGLRTLVVEGHALGGQAGTSRRIENYLGFPGGISGGELTTRAVTQARKFGARTATPYRATALRPDADGRHVLDLADGTTVRARAVVLATGAEYRRLPVDDLEAYEGSSVFYAAGPPEAQQCAASRVLVVGGGNSAAQAAIWLVRGGALVTLLHRRADLAETMSDYLVRDLDRYGVAVRDRSEITRLHGADGNLEAVTLTDGERLPATALFLFLGARPCTDWLGDAVATDDDGFVLTGPAAGADGLLETSVPGVFCAGDARSGSVKRCATAVGEGAMVVQHIHAHLNRVPA